MIERIVAFSARHRGWVLAATAVLCLLGWFSAGRVPLEAIPDLSETQVIVLARWDRDPGQIEAQVAYPLVNALTGLPGVRTVRAVSDFGASYVYTVFSDGTELAPARARVREALAGVLPSLPPGATATLGPDATSLGWVFQYVLVDRNGAHDPSELRSLQDWYVRPRLRTVPGVGEVAAAGGYGKQYQVNVDPLRLRAHDLAIGDVVDALRQSNTDTGAGLLTFGGTEAMVRGLGLARSARDLGDSVVSASPTGTPVRVADLGEVAVGAELRRGASDLDGKGEAVQGIVVMRDGASVPAVVAGVKARLAELAPGLPEGVAVLPVYDRSELIARAVAHLRWTLVEVVLTVAAVILVFLWHLPSAAIPIATIPAALLIAFLPFGSLGLTANIMSLAGLAIAVGALVDASIIVVEQTHVKLEEWERAGRPGAVYDVIVGAVQQVARPSFFALLLIAAAFLPVLTLGGDEGKLFRPLAYTKTFAMLAGALLAITLDPALRLTLTRPRALAAARPNPIALFLTRVYEPVVRWSLARGPWLLLGAALLAAATVPVALHLGSELMPPLEEGTLLYMPSTPPGIALAEARRLMEATDRVLAAQPEVAHVLGKVGRSTSATDPAPLSMAETVIALKPESAWPRISTWYSGWAPEWLKPALRPFTPDHASVAALTDRLNGLLAIPGVTNGWTQPIAGRLSMLATGMRAPLGLKVSGPDPEVVGRLGEQAARILEQLPGARGVYAEPAGGGTYVDVTWDREALARYGIPIQRAQEALAASAGGQEATTLLEGRARYPVSVRLMRDYREDLPALRRIPIPASIPGRQVQLGELGTVARRDGPSMLRDEDGLITGYVSVDLSGTGAEAFMEAGKRALAAQLRLPAGYSLRWDGQFAADAAARSRLKLAIPGTLLLVFLLLRLGTGSVFKAGLVMLAVPFSAVGAVLLLGAMGYHLSAAVWVGLLALAGVDAETGVFMLLYLDLAYAERTGKGRMRTRADLREAVVEGAARRIRPKVMTVAAMLAGLVPILWSSGPGAGVMKHVAVPMIGGIVTSFLLELLLYPVLYEGWRWASGGLQSRVPGRPAPVAERVPTMQA